MSQERRSESLRPGIAVSVLVINENNEILLGRRTSKLGNGMWALPGGKVERDETVLAAAERELMEESGIKLGMHRFVSSAYESFYGLEYLTFGVLTFTNEKPQELRPKEMRQWGWFNINYPPKPLFAPTKRIIRNFLSGRMRSSEPVIGVKQNRD